MANLKPATFQLPIETIRELNKKAIKLKTPKQKIVNTAILKHLESL